MTNGKVILASGIKLDKSYTNVLSYSTNQMLELVEANQEYNQSNYNCIDYTKNEIKVSCDYNTAIGCNYLAFQNPIHGNKWYFAFIDDVQFKSEGCSIVKFTLDVWSTFYDDWTEKPCFVVREHVNDDIIGKHTVPENVILGDYISSENSGGWGGVIDQLLLNPKIVISATVDEGGARGDGNIYNGIPTAYDYYRYNINDLTGVQKHINVANAQNGDINQMFIAPDYIIGGTIGAHLIAPSNIPKIIYVAFPDITVLDGYTPKNKKMLTWPFCYYFVSNQQGQDVQLKQELWDTSTRTDYDGETKTGKLLEIATCLTAGCSVLLTPIAYDGLSINLMQSVVGAKYPQLNWKTDPYINWLTQQGVNDYAKTIGDIFTGDFGSAFGSATNLIVSNAMAYRQPAPVHGNVNAGDVTFARGLCAPIVAIYTIKKEFATQIDNYFSRFGYKVNETKLANLTGRQYWNFVEIGKDEIIGTGTVPSKYMEDINNMFRQGVTIWHNHENLGNYNVANPIVT